MWLRYFEIYARIMTDYSSRQLSYESDILKAFQGLSSGISRLSSGKFYYGLPAVSLDYALLWLPTSPMKRREALRKSRIPSWSWAGWIGSATYNSCATSGAPSDSVHLVSYVKEFHIFDNGVSHLVERDNVPLSATDSWSSEYFKARQNTPEPPIPADSTDNWPQGCLHFWAEEACMDQFRCRFLPPPKPAGRSLSSHLFAFLYLFSEYQPCGILAPCSDFPDDLDADVRDPRAYSLVLMSESKKMISQWNAFRRKGLSDLGYSLLTSDYESFRYKCPVYFNVLLVRRHGKFVHRLAYGQAWSDAWLEADRRRRYMRMV
jgi:hypothetical protein